MSEAAKDNLRSSVVAYYDTLEWAERCNTAESQTHLEKAKNRVAEAQFILERARRRRRYQETVGDEHAEK